MRLVELQRIYGAEMMALFLRWRGRTAFAVGDEVRLSHYDEPWRVRPEWRQPHPVEAAVNRGLRRDRLRAALAGSAYGRMATSDGRRHRRWKDWDDREDFA